MRLLTGGAAAFLLVLAQQHVSCGSSDDPTELQCRDIARTYSFEYTNECAGTVSGNVVVLQGGCSINFALPGTYGGSVEGTLNGSTANFVWHFSPTCAGIGSGNFTVQSDGMIRGSFTGQPANLPCCQQTITTQFTFSPH